MRKDLRNLIGRRFTMVENVAMQDGMYFEYGDKLILKNVVDGFMDVADEDGKVYCFGLAELKYMNFHME